MNSLPSLARRLSPGALVTEPVELAAYAYDAAVRAPAPRAVVLARSSSDVVETVRYCAAEGIPFTARGAGTNLCGGATASQGGLLLSVARLDRILEIDTGRGYALVEPGVVNLALQKRLEPLGFFYAPDPASHKVCTIGGNIGENAGGPRCLKYGVTVNHLLALEAVMADGSLARFSLEDPGPEIVSLLAGSEGTLAVVVKAWLKILPAPEAVETFLAGFDTLEAAMECVGAVISSGVIPRSLEALDRATVESVDQYTRSGYPKTEAVLLVELDGRREDVVGESAKVEEVCARFGARDCRRATEAADRERLWEGRRGAYPATTRLAPNVLVEDGVVPRSKLPAAVRRVREIAARHKVRTSLVFHAGDGNIHPNISYDERNEEEVARVRAAGMEMLRACVELGGTVSGEHGIGLEKRSAMAWMFEPGALALFRRIKEAFDPRGIANPGKALGLADASGLPAPSPLVRPAPPPLSDGGRHVVERIRECSSGGRRMLVTGSSSRMPVAIPGKDGLAPIVTAGMRAVLELDKDDCCVTVEAGISLQALHLELGSQGWHLRLPKGGGTLGGFLAAKSGARDDLLGMRVALADGTVLDFGGKVVKNVAGYDIPKLLLGSWGTLAVILDATFKAYPLPPAPSGERRTCASTILEAQSFGDGGPLPPARVSGEGAGPLAGPWQRRVKNAFDPRNLLNPWFYDRGAA